MALAGASGVGKTFVARALAARCAEADPRAVIRWVGATASASHIPFGAFSHLLDLAPAAESATLLHAARLALCEGVDEARTMIVVDDAQHLDELSATLLHQLMLHTRVRVVLTLRDGVDAPDAVTALWKDQLLVRVEVEPLTAAESAELVSSVLEGPLETATADQLYAISGGNPLFLRHLVDEALRTEALRCAHGVWQLRGETPLSRELATLIRRQLALLDPDAMQVMRYLAIDEPLSVRDLSELVGADAVERAESAGAVTVTVRGADTVAQARHPIYTECVRADLGVLGGRRLASELVAQIAGRGPDHVSDRLRVAALSLDTDTPLGADELISASWEAMRLGDLLLGEQLADGALAAKDHLYARLPLSHSLAWQGRGAEADAVLSVVDVDTLSESDLVVWALPKTANQFWMRGESEKARELLADVRGKVTDPAGRDVLDALSATFALNAGEIEKSLRIAEGVLDSHIAGPLAIAWASATAALCDARLGRIESVPALAERGLQTLPPGLLRFTIGMGQTTAALLDADSAGAEALARRALEFAGIQQPGRAIGDVLLAHVLVARGAFDEASALLLQSAVALNDTGYSWGPLALMLQARVLGQRGDQRGAAAALARAEAAFGTRSAMYAPELCLARAWTLAAGRDLPAAIAEARRAVVTAEDSGQLGVAVFAIGDAVRMGDGRIADRAQRVCGRTQGVLAPLVARHARALATADAAGLAEVADAFAAHGMLPTAADAAAQAAVRFAAAGSGAAELIARSSARTWARACGSPSTPALERALTPLPLTGRERGIAVLVAEGLSNKAIAERLCVSVRTVEGHIYRSCTKLGVADRLELAAAVGAGVLADSPPARGQTVRR
ncbi:helix-turn-helix transcriptional regulator [Mycolicibacterium brumae]|uniref:LuxR family transcriptional regulator n=2 Tax=Mycolicibacterium brumae TaxID=85968 RepID=A0A2G5P6H2_9MYCO|nr:AAA family ATPase [Mycolicibacterium brumae]PIB73866.1 LuxR family transcriptional regulator [Mycolicibacterium brumae]